jgi:hypothetical protein
MLVGASILLESPIKPQKKPLHFCKGFVFCSPYYSKLQHNLIYW